jgi:hypothetical protein
MEEIIAESNKINELGLKPVISLDEGLRIIYKDFEKKKKI